MVKNMGGVDRVIRVVIAIVIGVLYFTGVIGGVLATILAILAVVFVLTSLMGSCPLYLPFKCSTVRKKAKGGA